MGKKVNIDEEKLLNLLLLYYELDTDNKEKIGWRNEIVEHLLPLMKIIASKYWQSLCVEDMVQEIARNTMERNIPEWVPGKNGPLGYFAKCFHNHCLNVCKSENLYNKRFVPTDPQDVCFWETQVDQSRKEIPFIADCRFEGVEQEAYEYCIWVVASDGIYGIYKDVRSDVVERFDLTHKEAENILGNAIVTVREALLDRRDTTNAKFDEKTLFGRLTDYLTEEQIGKIIAVFGGLKIRIPKNGE